MGERRRRMICGCGRCVAVLSNRPRPDGYLCIRYHKEPSGIWCTRNRLRVDVTADEADQ